MIENNQELVYKSTKLQSLPTSEDIDNSTKKRECTSYLQSKLDVSLRGQFRRELSWRLSREEQDPAALHCPEDGRAGLAEG